MSPRTPLLRPNSYFAERTPSIGRALAVVGLVTVAMGLGIYGIGWIFTERVDGTVLVDNPDRPDEAFCDGDVGDTLNVSGCDEPREVERNIDGLIWQAFGNVGWPVVLAIPFGWLLTGALLHAGTAIAGGEGSVGRSLAVAAWGFVPAIATVALALVVLWVTFDPVTISPGADPSVMQDRLLNNMGGLQAASPVLSLLSGLWGAAIWTFGLRHWRRVSTAAGAAVAGAVTLLYLVVGAA